MARECPLTRRLCCSQCHVNTHATEYCPELIKKWEERARHRGMNLVNAEPRGTVTPAMQNVAIVMRGGKKMRKVACETDPIRVIRPTSPKQLIRLEMQKKYFQEAIENFGQLGGDKDIELPMKKDTRE